MTTISHPLPDLEQTVVELIVELLLLEREQRYPDLIFGDPNDPKAVRVTAHYVMALRSYGFEPGDYELEEAVKWFETQFPRTRSNDMIDTSEMNRLMILLHLKPGSNGVQTRLEQLSKQYHDGFYDVQPGWQEYDTLWALEAFTLAKNQQVLSDDIVQSSFLKKRLSQLITSNDLKRDKDLALALRLHHRLVGDLYPEHVEVLHKLLDRAVLNNGVWGMREFGWQTENMRWYKELTSGNRLTHQHVYEHQQRFRKVVLSTCMVVESLVPLMDTYPEIREPVERAIRMWWGQFKGNNAVTTLRHLYPRPHDYDYLLVLSRTLRSIREFIQKPLRSLDTVHLLRQLTTFKTNTNESTEIRSIKEALRNWMSVELVDQPERLKLGFSEANVVRVKPYITNPLVNREATSQVSIAPSTLIIKYGPAEMIEAERKNYNLLPAATRDYFVRIPEDTYVDKGSNRSFVIMQDLHDYQTLYEIHEAVSQHHAVVADQLGVFLQRMHEGATAQYRPAPRSLMRDLYISPMMGYVDRIFNFIWEHRLFPQFGETEIREIQYELFERISDVIRSQRELEHFHAAYMHGDLHMRNIMVRGLHTLGPNELTFKLIDLEFTRQNGDAAFDAGQLMVDIDLVSREEQKVDHHTRLMNLANNLERSYSQFGLSREDHTFGIRMELAKARALLRIAKGKTKRGSKLVQTDQKGQAEQMSEEIVSHAAEALQYLQKVTGALEAV